MSQMGFPFVANVTITGLWSHLLYTKIIVSTHRIKQVLKTINHQILQKNTLMENINIWSKALFEDCSRFSKISETMNACSVTIFSKVGDNVFNQSLPGFVFAWKIQIHGDKIVGDHSANLSYSTLGQELFRTETLRNYSELHPFV